MSKVIRTTKPSVLPWYAAALVFAVLCAVLPVYKLWTLLVALGCAGAAFGAAQKVCPPRVVEHEVPFHTGSGDVDEMLADIQQKLDALHALNYYLPDAVNILEQYASLARQGVRGENAATIRSEVEHNAASIATAFENQLDALYAAESMDLSADLTVLQNMLKGQGLS